MELLEGMRSDCDEGNISWFPERQKTLANIIKTYKPKTLLQIGFNMGHSALLICDVIAMMKSKGEYTEEPVVIHIFDICEHECVIPNFNILEKKVKDFNIFLNLIPGSSLETLPNFMKSNSITFDLVEIDGCHKYECLMSDIINTIDRINPNGLIYIDDYKSSRVNIPDVDNCIDDFNWDGFKTSWIDGAFWAEKLNVNEVLEKEHVDHPKHYGGEDNPYEVIKVIDAWDLGFSLGNTVKYISRAGKKEIDKELQDLKKALWYLQHHIETLEKK